MTKEIWKDIPGYKGIYQVSNLGRIKSLDKEWIMHNGGIRHKQGRILRTVRDGTGYGMVSLCMNSKQKIGRVHRLVAEAFIPNPHNKPQVNHIDGNRLNNIESNLEWVTASENILHADRIGLRNIQKGENHPFYGTTKKGKTVIDNSTGMVYESAREAAKCTGMKYQTLAGMLNGWNKNTTSMKYSEHLKY